MSRILASAVLAALLSLSASAQDKPGTVRIVASKTIWKADGMTVTHAQFTPDGQRIVFTARGKDSVLNASVCPDGTDFQKPVEPPVRGAPLDTSKPVGSDKCVAKSPGGTLIAATKDLPSPVGIVRGAGLWVRPTHVMTTKQAEILNPKAWLVGVAYYKHMIAWAPPRKGEKESRRIRFIGARIKPFPGLKHRPLCVWEVAINDQLERVGEPKRLGTFGWCPRFFRGDPALHGATGWNVGIGAGQYMADFSTGKVYKFAGRGFGRVNATYSPGCSLVALPGKTLCVLTLEKKD